MPNNTKETIQASTRKCPAAADTALAVLSGMDHLSDAQQGHLLNPGGCTVCEDTLTQVLVFECPSPLTLSRLGNQSSTYPETSAFGKVLREHVKACDAQLCVKATAALEADDSQ